MKILADVNPIYSGHLTGIGYYADELLKHLSKMCELEGFAFNFRGTKQIDTVYPVNEQRVLPGKLLSYPRYAKIDVPLSTFFRLKRFDAVLGTNYILPPTGKVPSVATVHDLCFIDHPQWVQSRNAMILKRMLPKTLSRSSGVIVISEFTKNRLLEIYNYKKPILVIGIPPRKSTVKPVKPKNKLIVSGKYFLFVGTIEPRKNISTLIDAFEAIPRQKQSTHKLVLAGKPGWDSNTLHRIRGGKSKNIIYLDYVSEGERNWLYKNAIANILPSHYEGFGMTILEALNDGSPSITSDIPPHKEILGSNGEYFDPKDAVGLMNLLNKFTNEAYAKKVFEKQKKVLQNYSWPQTAKMVNNFLEKVVTENV